LKRNGYRAWMEKYESRDHLEYVSRENNIKMDVEYDGCGLSIKINGRIL